MHLPYRSNAYIPATKLTEYLLSETHPLGKAKARFFRSFGFDETNLDVFEQGLLAVAQEQEIQEVKRSPYGAKYVIEGILPTPSGLSVSIRTVWILETGEVRPRFVTAHPP